MTLNKKYTISQSPGKGIEVIIESKRHPNYRPVDDITVRFWIPSGTKSPETVTENTNEVSIYPVPKEVLEDLQQRTQRDLKIEYVEESGKEEFYIQTQGNILMGTI